MKKGLFVLIGIVILIAFAGFLNYDAVRETSIKVSLFDLSAQLTDLRQWENWNSQFIKKSKISVDKGQAGKQSQSVTLPNGKVLTLTVLNPTLLLLDQKGNGSGATQSINIHASKLLDHTDVQWVYEQSGFEWLRDKLTGGDKVSAELNNLKHFAESTAHLYGFPIELTSVTDPIICTKKQVVAAGNLQAEIEIILADIKQFLKLHSIPAKNQHYYVSHLPVLDGKVELAVGIPVNITLKTMDGFDFLKFPKGGRLLVGNYTGKQAQTQQLYLAMDKYVMDKKLSKVAQSMEKYTVKPAAVKDSTWLHMQLIYPVY
jgi:hypothetical protein